uniref:aminoglycoside phosphotransferase family protein n=1 Tax=Citrobacter freundii TaxID=546 RepID=UPI0020181DA3|nr:aminoglycoside phosphotransferase family protein [Citrobacter freundii]
MTETAGLDRERLLMWICAWCGLSAAWTLKSNGTISVTTRIAELAISELNNCTGS